VFFARDIDKLGLTDEEQLETAIQERAVIFTHDVDFIKIAINKNHPSIIYVHQQKMIIGECIKRLKIIAETKTSEQLHNQIIFL
jgi:predicted nuclease of predicted toxin-antitoxin system